MKKEPARVIFVLEDPVKVRELYARVTAVEGVSLTPVTVSQRKLESCNPHARKLCAGWEMLERSFSDLDIYGLLESPTRWVVQEDFSVVQWGDHKVGDKYVGQWREVSEKQAGKLTLHFQRRGRCFAIV